MEDRGAPADEDKRSDLQDRRRSDRVKDLAAELENG
jgi:hypothetical protein